VRGAIAAVVGVSLAVLALGGGSSACTLTLPGSDDGGAEGGTTTTQTQTQTVGDQCSTIATELCMQAPRCNLGSFSVDCVNSEVAACCTGSACNAKSQSTASQVSACTQAIDNLDCNLIVNYSATTEPPECQGVPQMP
jgi:hypothetical protein